MKPITIIGGGLAGLTLGIGLRLRELPVTILEAGSYPRHKVCGEFISGRGQATLTRFGLMPRLLEAGARWAHDAAFFIGAQPVAHLELPQPALCLSRYALDDLLAKEFRRLGGDWRERQRWANGFAAPGIVRATGHGVAPVVTGWRWLGLKAHAPGIELAADLELHVFRDGYVGLCRLADAVNVCGLFRVRQPIPDLRHGWQELLSGPADSVLRQRLASARLDAESFCAVAGLNLESHAADAGECAVGDALTMIAPATGNGMSMALEAAELALDPLARYSAGTVAWGAARHEIAGTCHRRFATRLSVSAQLQRMIFQPVGCNVLRFFLGRFPAGLRLVFAGTR